MPLFRGYQKYIIRGQIDSLIESLDILLIYAAFVFRLLAILICSSFTFYQNLM